MRYMLIKLLTFSPFVNSLSNRAIPPNYSQYISGLWAKVYDDNGNIYFYNHYFPNGQLHSYGYTDPNDPKSYFFADGSWEIKGNSSCITINYSSDNSFDQGSYWCDTIVEIKTKIFIYKSSDKNVTMHRVSNGKIK